MDISALKGSFIVLTVSGSILASIVLIPIAAFFAGRKKYGTGTILGAASLVLMVVFEWLWHSAFVRPDSSFTWYERAISKMGAPEIVILVGGLLVTLLNVLLLVRRKHRSPRAQA